MTPVVAGKDLRVLWTSPVPYIVGAMFQLVLTLLYVPQLEARKQALMQPLFPIAGFLLLVMVPVLCMRAFAEEARTGTLDLLLAVPVAARPLVVGKWLAAWTTSLAVLAPAGLFTLLLRWFGHPDSGPIIAGFAGLVVFTAALAGVGVLGSSVSSSQPVAAVLAFFVSLLLWFAHLGGFLAPLSFSDHLRSFAGGAFDLSDVTFFAVVASVSLVLATGAIDGRRLR